MKAVINLLCEIPSCGRPAAYSVEADKSYSLCAEHCAKYKDGILEFCPLQVFRIKPASQAPSPQWKPPTEAEIRTAYETYTSNIGDFVKVLLNDFVANRNAALLPKPVDPRVQIIRNHVSQWRMGDGTTLTECSEQILAAIDKVEANRG
jgi:hypothetical protein